LNANGRPFELTRRDLADRVLVTLKRGGWPKPDVLLVETGFGNAVVKDFAPRRRWVARTLGRWLIRRELRVYRVLSDHPAVPRVLGSIDELAFAIEHRGGPRLSRRRPWTFSAGFGRCLATAVAGLHDRGVAHLDLRHRSNIHADVAGRPVLVDFGSAVFLPPGSLAGRYLLPLLATVDRRAVKKWQRRLSYRAGAGTTSEGLRGASRPT
jgi:hypothetical protein